MIARITALLHTYPHESASASLFSGQPLIEELWDGWYAHLFYQKDDNPALIADVHTNPTDDPASELYPPRILHAATGPVAAEFFVVDTDERWTIYVGPAYTYFEVITTGSATASPERFDNGQWRVQLREAPYPAAPTWTQSFRLSVQTPPVNAAIDHTSPETERSFFLPFIQKTDK